MEKKIPTLFDVQIIEQPSIQEVLSGNSNLNRIQVRAFTKYGNRNGSYITDAVADQLIASATQGDTPVIGFFDPSTKSWASHTGPALAKGYGYVENFVGWQPFIDTDGISREYAVFSVVLFTKYYEEARNIFGQNQSMELDPSSIEGAWTTIDGEEYFVYSAAKMLGFCVIGSNEPCFSVSAFFAKKDDNELSSLIFELRTLIEEQKKIFNGGEQPMEVVENIQENVQQEVVESTPQETETENFEAMNENTEENENTQVTEEVPVENNEEETSEDSNNWQQRFEELQVAYNELQASNTSLQARVTELEAFQENSTTQLENLSAENEQLHTTIVGYEAQLNTYALEEKKNLINKYTTILSEEEITSVNEHINDFSYDELESKLAIMFANHQLSAKQEEVTKVPLPEPQESQFALLMKKYRKN